RPPRVRVSPPDPAACPPRCGVSLWFVARGAEPHATRVSSHVLHALFVIGSPPDHTHPPSLPSSAEASPPPILASALPSVPHPIRWAAMWPRFPPRPFLSSAASLPPPPSRGRALRAPSLPPRRRGSPFWAMRVDLSRSRRRGPARARSARPSPAPRAS